MIMLLDLFPHTKPEASKSGYRVKPNGQIRVDLQALAESPEVQKIAFLNKKLRENQQERQ